MLLPACKLKGLAQFRLLAAKVFTVGIPCHRVAGGTISPFMSSESGQDSAMLHMAVIKHHGHVADRAAIIDAQIGRLHDAILEEWF
jgi:hypothetical protein